MAVREYSSATLGLFLNHLWNYEPGLVDLIRAHFTKRAAIRDERAFLSRHAPLENRIGEAMTRLAWMLMSTTGNKIPDRINQLKSNVSMWVLLQIDRRQAVYLGGKSPKYVLSPVHPAAAPYVNELEFILKKNEDAFSDREDHAEAMLDVFNNMYYEGVADFENSYARIILKQVGIGGLKYL